MIPAWLDAAGCRFVRIEALRFARQHLTDYRADPMGFRRRLARHALAHAAECRKAEVERQHNRKAA